MKCKKCDGCEGEYRYIRMVLTGDTGKTKRWADTVYSAGCLQDIMAERVTAPTKGKGGE